MKQIQNGFADYYYLSEKGEVYNAQTKKYLKACNSHCLKLDNGSEKNISTKKLYMLVYGKVFCNDDIPDLEGEEWRDVVDTQGYYQVSNMGRIKSLQGLNAVLLKPYKNKAGYVRVDIMQAGQRQQRLVQRIVADAFLPPPPSIDYQVHHKTFNKEDNRAAALEWLSPAEHRKKHIEKRKQNECSELEENNN